MLAETSLISKLPTMTSKTFSTGTPPYPSPDIDCLSYGSLSAIDDTTLYPPTPALGGLPFCPQPDIGGLSLCPEPDIPLWPLPNNFYTHLSPSLSATPIKNEGYLGIHLAPPTLYTQTLSQELDEDQELIFNLEQGNVQPGMSLLLFFF